MPTSDTPPPAVPADAAPEPAPEPAPGSSPDRTPPGPTSGATSGATSGDTSGAPTRPGVPGARVAVVDDEAMVREVTGRYLRTAGYDVVEYDDGDRALRGLRTDPVDLVVLDVMLPGRNGWEVLRELRRGSEVPVIMLTARGGEAERVGGLELGADDYVTKPFSPRELVARVRSVLRRAPVSTDVVEVAGLAIDPVARTVTRDGTAIDLTRREFDLLHHFATHPGEVFSRAELLRAVWESSPEWKDPSTVTVHVRRLRSKLEPRPSDPVHLVTQWGVGYRFDP